MFGVWSHHKLLDLLRSSFLLPARSDVSFGQKSDSVWLALRGLALFLSHCQLSVSYCFSVFVKTPTSYFYCPTYFKTNMNRRVGGGSVRWVWIVNIKSKYSSNRSIIWIPITYGDWAGYLFPDEHLLDLTWWLELVTPRRWNPHFTTMLPRRHYY